MRMLRCCALMMLPLLVLSACTGTTLEDDAVRVAQRYSETTSIEALAAVTAFYEDRNASFLLRCTLESGTASVLVEEPESLAGITAVSSGDGLSLVFEDTVLAAGTFSVLELSPMAMLPLTFHQLKAGFPSSRLLEENTFTFSYPTAISSRDAVFDITLDRTTDLPLSAVLYLEGQQILTAEFQQCLLQ